MINNLRTAIGFLTRIPINTPQVVLSEAAPWFPVVGLGIGLIQAATFVGLNAALPAGPAAVLSVAVAALVTGAFHHDGLADMTDAFGGGWNVEQRLEIMKDSRLGTYGTVALILAIATEISVLATLTPTDGARVIIAGHCLSRAIAVAAMRFAPLARSAGREAEGLAPDAEAKPGLGGLGAAYAQDLSTMGTLVALGFGLAVTAAALAAWWAAVGVVVALLAAIAVVALAIAKIGGISGDVLGAIQQLSYLALLVTASGFIAAGS